MYDAVVLLFILPLASGLVAFLMDAVVGYTRKRNEHVLF